MARSRRRLAGRSARALCAALLVAGCSLQGPLEGGTAGLDGSDAAKAHAYYVATAIGLEALAAGVQYSRKAGGAGAVDTLPYALTRDCQYGGSVASSGEVAIQTDVDPARAVVDIAATEVHDGCRILAGSSQVTVTGAPHVNSTVHAASRAGALWGAQSATVVGAVAWRLEDGTGDSFCKLNYTVTVDGGMQRVSGQICGYAIDLTTPTG